MSLNIDKIIKPFRLRNVYSSTFACLGILRPAKLVHMGIELSQAAFSLMGILTALFKWKLNMLLMPVLKSGRADHSMMEAVFLLVQFIYHCLDSLESLTDMQYFIYIENA